MHQIFSADFQIIGVEVIFDGGERLYDVPAFAANVQVVDFATFSARWAWY